MLDFRFSCSHKDPHVSPESPRASRHSVLLPVVCFRSVCPVSLRPSSGIPTRARALSPTLSLAPPRCAAGAQKVGAPRAPENFLIDPRAPYSTCDSSSPLLISFPGAAARTSLSFPRRESRYRRHLRFHRRRWRSRRRLSDKICQGAAGLTTGRFIEQSHINDWVICNLD